MAKNVKTSIRLSGGIVEIKSKVKLSVSKAKTLSQADLVFQENGTECTVNLAFDAEFRRFSIDKTKTTQFDDFYLLLEQLHHLIDIPFIVTYTDPVHMDLLPINNSENFSRALSTAKPGLKVLIQRKGESYGEVNGYGTQPKKRNPLSKLVNAETSPRPRVQISLMEDFRRVSAIIDVDIVPETHRRVRLMKNGSDKPLGFYIRDGTSVRTTLNGLEKVPAIFISRLVPGGLAESTGLLAVNDEVLEVNGIEVAGKKLDQVTDMMVANSSNLIITVKPVNQGMTLAPTRGGYGRHSNISSTSHTSSHYSQASNVSYQSAKSFDSADAVPEGEEEDDDDEVHDHISPQPKNPQDNYFSQMRHEEDRRSGGSSGRRKGGKSKSSSAAASSSSAGGGGGSSSSSVLSASASGGGAVGGAAAMSSAEHQGGGEGDDPVLTL